MLNLGPLLLQPLIEHHLEEPLLSVEAMRQWQEANAALAMHGMLSRATGTSRP
jgi:hypothetical protein